MQWSVIDRWGWHPLLAKTHASLIQSALETGFPEKDRKDVTILFSAHSLPLEVAAPSLHVFCDENGWNPMHEDVVSLVKYLGFDLQVSAIIGFKLNVYRCKSVGMLSHFLMQAHTMQ